MCVEKDWKLKELKHLELPGRVLYISRKHKEYRHCRGSARKV